MMARGKVYRAKPLVGDQPPLRGPGKMLVQHGSEALGLGGPDPALAFGGCGRCPRG